MVEERYEAECRVFELNHYARPGEVLWVRRPPSCLQIRVCRLDREMAVSEGRGKEKRSHH